MIRITITIELKGGGLDTKVYGCGSQALPAEEHLGERLWQVIDRCLMAQSNTYKLPTSSINELTPPTTTN